MVPNFAFCDQWQKNQLYSHYQEELGERQFFTATFQTPCNIKKYSPRNSLKIIIMSETRKRYKGLCAFQDRCMFTSDQCKFIHVLTETNLNKAVRELIDEVLKISKLPSLEQQSKNKRSSNVEEILFNLEKRNKHFRV